MAKHLSGIVHLRALEPNGARHGVGAERAFKGRRGLYLVELPNAAPKCFEVRDRPTPQGRVVLEVKSVIDLQPVLVATDLRRRRTGWHAGQMIDAVRPKCKPIGQNP